MGNMAPPSKLHVAARAGKLEVVQGLVEQAYWKSAIVNKRDWASERQCCIV